MDADPTACDGGIGDDQRMEAAERVDDGGEPGEAHLGLPGMVEWVRAAAEAGRDRLAEWYGSGTSRSMAWSSAFASV